MTWKKKEKERDWIRPKTDSASTIPFPLFPCLPSASQPRAYCAPSTLSCYVLDHDQISTRTCIPHSVNHIICHRGQTHFFVHSLAVLKNAPLSFFNCCIQSQFRFGSPVLILATYRCYLRLKRIIGTRIIHLFLDDGKHYNMSYKHSISDPAIPYL